jgi:hypothetical protein
MSTQAINFHPQSAEDKLAVEIATEFADLTHLPVYVAFCRRYPQAVIRKAFEATQKFPPEKIRKSKGALFTYLVKHYANQQKP